eukprot:39331_1
MSAENEQITELNKEDITSELDSFHKLIALIISILGITLIMFVDTFTSTQRIAILSACLMGISWIEWLIIFFNTKYLHQIRVATKFILTDNKENYKYVFGKLSVPYKIIHHYDTAITSISELSAMRGSNQYKILLQMNYVMAVSMLCSLFININQKNEIHFILAFIVSIGYIILSYFEMNTCNILHTVVHMIGANLICLIQIAFVLQQNWSVFAIILFIISIITMCSWVLFHFYDFKEKLPYKSNDKQKIHNKSWYCIIIEIFGMISVT